MRWFASVSGVHAITASSKDPPILVAGAGIGGLAVALALARQGYRVTVMEQTAQLGEIGAGVQLGPNAFEAFDALGIGKRARARAVYPERMVMMDAVDGGEIASVPLGDDFRRHFGHPYAVMHRADIHGALLEGVREQDGIELLTGTRVESFAQEASGVIVLDGNGAHHHGAALIGCDGVKSVVRENLVGDAVRTSGHVVYRAVVEAADFPQDLRWNAAVVWAGPDGHLVHYPLRRGEQYNVVVTFHSRKAEAWSVTDGSKEEVLSYFTDILDRPRQLLHLPKDWKRWATADRDPIKRWSQGPVTLLGDAAHPMLQYLAQGACMALEDAVTLGETLRVARGGFAEAFELYQRARIVRTARATLLAREMGRIYHTKGVERLVRNDLWRDRSAEHFYDALQWLYGWRAAACVKA